MVKRYIALMIFILSTSLLAQAKTTHKIDEIDRMVGAFLESRYLVKSDVSHKNEVVVTSKQKANFIQLGAFSDIKPIKLIKRLKQAGYRIRLKPIVRNSQRVNLLLAGPYLTEDQTQKYLYKLRIVVSGAFVHRP